MNIEELRTKTDKIDSEILKLLNDRMNVVHEIGVIKSASNESVYSCLLYTSPSPRDP